MHPFVVEFYFSVCVHSFVPFPTREKARRVQSVSSPSGCVSVFLFLSFLSLFFFGSNGSMVRHAGERSRPLLLPFPFPFTSPLTGLSLSIVGKSHTRGRSFLSLFLSSLSFLPRPAQGKKREMTDATRRLLSFTLLSYATPPLWSIPF